MTCLRMHQVRPTTPADESMVTSKKHAAAIRHSRTMRRASNPSACPTVVEFAEGFAQRPCSLAWLSRRRLRLWDKVRGTGTPAQRMCCSPAARAAPVLSRFSGSLQRQRLGMPWKRLSRRGRKCDSRTMTGCCHRAEEGVCRPGGQHGRGGGGGARHDVHSAVPAHHACAPALPMLQPATCIYVSMFFTAHYPCTIYKLTC